MQQGVIPWETPWQLYKGLPFSLTLLIILLCHEMGHYLMARYHQLDVSLPYFLPAPPIPFLIGTLGAFIRIRSPILNKPALLDVGAAGPLSGVLVTLPLLVIGLQLSDIQVVSGNAGELAGIVLGESILFKIMCWLTLGSLPDNYNIIMHPMAFAGWIGLLVTNINLIPVGQLDGGHVSYALFGERSQQIAKIFYLLLIIFGLDCPGMAGCCGWYYCILWDLCTRRPCSTGFLWTGNAASSAIFTIAVFILTFMPAPFLIQ